MSLRLAASLPERSLEVDLAVPGGETLALLGPNGAGKSTVLGIVAGLVRPSAGRATLDGSTLFDLPGSWPAPHRRGVALLAQEALLFPHLSVRHNVEFGPRSAGLPRSAAAARADEWLDRTGTAAFAGLRPGELSGGQAQRVAIARALAAEPRLLLLDEPLSALDVTVAAELRTVLSEVLEGRTTVLVTHYALDAYLLADRVAVLESGRVVEEGPARAVFEHPRHPFTAELSGLSLVSGRRSAGGLITESGALIPGIAAGPLAEGAAVTAVVRPSAVRVETPRSTADTDPGIPARVIALEPHADLVRVRTDVLTALVPPAVIAEARLLPGAAVTLRVAPEDVAIRPV
ncbi:sulfate/molybdate ABC transporter ATP-binding protein [Leifsonia sp. AG29]|uniref:sulfate/molybdate ABC transporter ATP-binding protein n=1 Tax=Leifsonia sp. AG29 TaxID=2598860 RepID=UPI00131E077B|nr:ABC transporter ATP-binding protein [Leifsonia sp. AG29]